MIPELPAEIWHAILEMRTISMRDDLVRALMRELIHLHRSIESLDEYQSGNELSANEIVDMQYEREDHCLRMADVERQLYLLNSHHYDSKLNLDMLYDEMPEEVGLTEFIRSRDGS